MMLLYSFSLPHEARAIEEAVRLTIDAGVTTGDVGGSSSTKEVGDRVAQELQNILAS